MRGSWSETEVARFAEMLADGVPIWRAAALLGRGAAQGKAQFDRMRRQLGRQAR